MEWKNEKDIEKKLKQIARLIPDEQKNLIAKYITSKILIERRDYISKLTKQDIHNSVNSVDKLNVLFDDANP